MVAIPGTALSFSQHALTFFFSSVLSDVNSSHPIPIKTDHFEGEISIWVKDYNGLRKKGDGSEFFNQEGRSSMTYSLVVRGKLIDRRYRVFDLE